SDGSASGHAARAKASSPGPSRLAAIGVNPARDQSLVWILTTFMRELPLELEEAAIMDGCGPLRIIMKVFMPLLWPAMASTGLLAFIGAWNEFLFALSFMIGDDQRTVPVGISMIAGNSSFEIPWGTIMAASIIVTLPLLALVLVFQQRIVSGLTAGAIKG
ncbi:MAG: carbohydrate ABC transporter permease, partial [Betaproteobacteria bacterium]|nr:carbohydrate ABC transporter permease [Betaproteobacteria bacterium]